MPRILLAAVVRIPVCSAEVVLKDCRDSCQEPGRILCCRLYIISPRDEGADVWLQFIDSGFAGRVQLILGKCLVLQAGDCVM